MKVVSACLAGEKCRYNGKDSLIPEIKALVDGGEAIPVCPEILGGFGVPRDPAEIINGEVISDQGENLTGAFQAGARMVLAICQRYHVTKAILKSRSPSCGSGTIYDGTFTGARVAGDGITAALLKENGVTVISSDDIQK